MNQNIWGPPFWLTLHTISFNYPLKPTQQDKINYKIFYTSFQNVIPCSICKKNYIRHLKEHPIDNYLSSRRKLSEWVIDMHNMVNGETGKKILSYDVVVKKYEDIYKKKIELDPDNSNIIEGFSNQNNIQETQNIQGIQRIIYIILFIFLILLFVNAIFR
jgi:hypothetical protein